MKRGDVVRVATGKPRPAVVVQSDRIDTPNAILLCPFTSTLVDAPLYRINVEPTAGNALTTSSQLMADKVGPAPRHQIGGVIGRLDEATLQRLDATLALILDLGR